MLPILKGTIASVGPWQSMFARTGHRVYPYTSGTRVRSSSTGTSALVNGVGTFQDGDYLMPCSEVYYGESPTYIPDPSRITRVATAAGSVNASAKTMTLAASVALYSGEWLLNLGSAVNYTGSPITIYSDPNGDSATGSDYLIAGQGGTYVGWLSKGTTTVDLMVTDSSGTPVVVHVQEHLSAPSSGSVFNVKDFGATGDGSTDDTEAIQAAIEAAEILNSTVYLPPGTYMISATLGISKRITFQGAGRGDPSGDDKAATTIQKSADVVGIIIEDGANYTILRDFLLYAALTGDTTNGIEVGQATTSNGVTGCEISQVTCWGTGNVGIDIRNGNSGKLDTVFCIGCIQAGIQIDSDNTIPSFNCNAWTLINCMAGSNGVAASGVGDGLRIVDGRDITVIGGDFESNAGRGIYTNGPRNFIRSYSENNVGYDLEVGSLALGSFLMTRTGAVATKVLLSTDKCVFIDQGATNNGRLQAYEFVAKGRPNYNVMAYGAVADGVTNDSPAIQAAIDAADADSNGEVYFPEGVYLLDTGIEISDEIILVGAGEHVTFLKAGTASMTMVAQKNPGTRFYRAGMRDMSLLGNSLAAIGLDLVDCSLAWFQRVNISSLTTAIKISGTQTSVHNTFIDVDVLTCTTAYLLEGTAPNENRFIACRGSNCTSRGFDIQGGSHNVLLDCSIETNATGVYIEGDAGNIAISNEILNCRFEGNTVSAVTVVGANSRLTNIVGGYWTGNTASVTDSGDRTMENWFGVMSLPEVNATPSDPLVSAQARFYFKDNKIIFMYDDAGTVRYKYLDLTGTGVTWVAVTSAP